MSEHDAPTLARATVWLDTSTETTTRPDELATTVFSIASAPAATQVLDRHSLIAALDPDGTVAFEPEHQPIRSGAERAVQVKPWRHIASHAFTFALGGACVLLALAARPAAAPQRVATREPPPPALHAAEAAAKPSPPEPPAPSDVSLALAVDALSRGEYAAAHAQYAALARQHPNDAALARIAARLAARSAQPCAGGDGTEVPCVR